MKKHLLIFVALTLLFSVLLSGCGGGSKKKDNNNNVNAFATFVEMVSVPGAKSFPIGINDDKDCTEVNYSFFMAKTAVTYQLWAEVYNWAINNGYVLKNGTGDGKCPVVNVSWLNAIVWCNALTEYSNAKYNANLQPVYKDHNGEVLRNSSLTESAADLIIHLSELKINDQIGNGFRLPTCNEWELAARFIDGKNWTPGNYASGASAPVDNFEATNQVAWNEAQPMPIAQKRPNALGIYDMSGNVAEWCGLSAYNIILACIKGFGDESDLKKLSVGYVSDKVFSAEFSYAGFRVVRNLK